MKPDPAAPRATNQARRGTLWAVALVAGILLATTFAGNASALKRPMTLRLTFTVTRHAYVDVGAKGSSVGDVDVLSGPLFGAGRTKPLGHLEATLTTTDITGTPPSQHPESFNTTITAYLPQGKIIFGGAQHERPTTTFAILGGTGDYANARGEVTTQFVGETKAIFTFHLTP